MGRTFAALDERRFAAATAHDGFGSAGRDPAATCATGRMDIYATGHGDSRRQGNQRVGGYVGG